jgi:DNA-directed RNA polymerase subunit RPC12/RpoP
VGSESPQSIFVKCDDCRREWEWVNNSGHLLEDEINCPYCNHEYIDSWDYSENEECLDCEECGRKFDIEVITEIKYTTRRSVCEMPGDWQGGDSDE